MTDKIPLKDQLAAIDTKNKDWWNTLDEESRNKMSMWTMMRFCSSTSSRVKEINEHYLVMTNELVNVNFNDLRHHPELQFALMTTVGLGTKQYHQWIPPGKRKSLKNVNKNMYELILKLNPELNDEEIALVINSMDKEEKIEFLEDAGIEKKKVKDYL